MCQSNLFVAYKFSSKPSCFGQRDALFCWLCWRSFLVQRFEGESMEEAERDREASFESSLQLPVSKLVDCILQATMAPCPSLLAVHDARRPGQQVRRMYAFSLSDARRTTSAVSLSVLVACTVFSFLGIFHAGLSHPSYFETIMSPPTPQSNVKIRDTSAAKLDDSHAAKASPDTRSRRLLDIAENSTTTPGFQWEYLDLKRNGTCGYRKCFFYSSTEETEGYLVARPIKDDYLPRMLRIEKETKRLEKKYNIRHFSIESPQNVGVPPKKILKKLNKLAVGPKKSSSYYGSTKKEKYNATNSSLAFGLVVQKVKIAPTPSLIVRCAFFKQKGKFYFDDHSATKEDFRSAVDDKASFVSIFDGELKQLIKLLGKESRLWRDFQFMVDPRGRIHHLDLDRMEMDTFRLPSSQGAQTCLSSAITTVVKILLDERNATLVATSRR